jgi:hypothetical protein
MAERGRRGGGRRKGRGRRRDREEEGRRRKEEREGDRTEAAILALSDGRVLHLSSKRRYVEMEIGTRTHILNNENRRVPIFAHSMIKVKVSKASNIK